jgi:hypothetical protein
VLDGKSNTTELHLAGPLVTHCRSPPSGPARVPGVAHIFAVYFPGLAYVCVTHDVPAPHDDVTLYFPSQSSVAPETAMPIIWQAKPGQGDIVHVSHDTDEQPADTVNNDCPDESSMSIDGPPPHWEVMQYEPTAVNVIDAFPGELVCRMGASPSLLQPRVASDIDVQRSTRIIGPPRSFGAIGSAPDVSSAVRIGATSL